MDRLLDLKEAATFLNIKESKLRNAVFKKEVPYIKIGRLLRFRKNELELYLKQNSHEPVIKKEV